MNRRRLTSCCYPPTHPPPGLLLVRLTAHSTVANTFKMRRQHVQRSQSTSCPDPGINLVPLERQCNRYGDSQPAAAGSAARLDIKRSSPPSLTVPYGSPAPTSPPSAGNSVCVCMVAKGSSRSGSSSRGKSLGGAEAVGACCSAGMWALRQRLLQLKRHLARRQKSRLLTNLLT